MSMHRDPGTYTYRDPVTAEMAVDDEANDYPGDPWFRY